MMLAERVWIIVYLVFYFERYLAFRSLHLRLLEVLECNFAFERAHHS